MLSISIVTYKTDVNTIAQLLDSIDQAVAISSPIYNIDSIIIIDNSPNSSFPEITLSRYIGLADKIKTIKSSKNLGYGTAHNIAIQKSTSKYHLILNPDVIIDNKCLMYGLRYLELNENVVGVAPETRNDKGKIQNLTKSYPAIFDLFIRGINSKRVNDIFSTRLDKYKNKDIHAQRAVSDVLLISGCFMLCRNNILKKIGGFNENYFLYFEDYSLSLELNKYGVIRYLPEMKIQHFGGHAARKGLKHKYYFVNSAIKFYTQYGWKLY